jgi:SAM-dependent methyltransferase
VTLSFVQRARRERARRASVRNVVYQTAKANAIAGREEAVIDGMRRSSGRVLSTVAAHVNVAAPRVLEVGSGAHGLIFYFDSAGLRVGIDPAAVEYSTLFPLWQRRAITAAAAGEALPLRTASFDVVLCDNVIDHALHPRAIVSELVRVLRPGGVLYFTVNVHHPIYTIASLLHGAWNALGVRFEIGPFADHTLHLTPRRAKRWIHSVALRVLAESVAPGEARAKARRSPVRHPGDYVKRLFFKNAVYEVVAVRDESAHGASPGL